jgi:hypothetical protein
MDKAAAIQKCATDRLREGLEERLFGMRVGKPPKLAVMGVQRVFETGVFRVDYV